MKIFKKIILYFSIFLACLLVLTSVLSFVVLKNLGDINEKASEVFNEIKKNTGYEIKIENIELKSSFKPYIDVKLKKFIVYNPENNVVFKTKEAKFSVKLLPLIRKKIVIADVYSLRPVVNIDYDYKRPTQFEIEPLSFKGFELVCELNHLNADNYKVKVYDFATKKTFVFEGNKLSLSDFDILKSFNIKADGSLSSDEREYVRYNVDASLPFEILRNNKNDFSPFKTIYDYKFSGDVLSKLKGYKEKQRFVFDGNIKADNFSFVAGGHKYDKNNFELLFDKDNLKFSSLFNVSDTDSAKVNGILKLGNNKKIKINVLSKNANLTKIHEFYNVVSKVLNLKMPLNDFNVTGHGDFDFDVDSDFKTLNSRGKATVSNASVSHVSLPFKVNNINAQVSFNDNNIKIEQADALVNNNRLVIKGDVSNSLMANLSISANNLDLKNILPLFYSQSDLILNTGKLDFDSTLNGQLNSDYKLNVNVALHNVSGTDKKKSIAIKPFNAKLNLVYSDNKFSGNISGDDLILNLIKNKSDVIFKKYDLEFSNNQANLKNGKIQIYDSLLDVSFDINNVFTDNMSLKSIVAGEINSVDAQKLISNFYFEKSSAKGKLPIEIKIDYLTNSPVSLSAKIGANKDNYLSLLVIKELLNRTSLLNFAAKLDGDKLDIQDASLYDIENTSLNNALRVKTEKLKKIISVNGHISSIQKSTLNSLKVNIPNSLTCKTSLFDGIDLSLSGNLVLNGEISKPKIQGEINLQHAYSLTAHTTLNNAIVKFNDDNVNINAPDVDIAGSKFNVIADILPKFDDKIEIQNAKVYADSLNLNTLTSAFDKIKGDEYFPGIKVPLTIKQGECTLNKFFANNIQVFDVVSNFKFSDNVLSLNNMTGKSSGGIFGANIKYNFLSMNLNGDVDGKNFDVNKLIRMLSGYSSDVYGQADVKTDFSMMLSANSNQLKSLRGHANFISKDIKLGELGQFERYLQAQNIVHGGLDNTNFEKIQNIAKNHNTAFFKIGDGRVNFEDGILNVEHVNLQGRLMSLLIQGRYNILNEYSNLNLYGRVSNEVLGELERQNISQYQNIPQLLDNSNYGNSEFKVNIKGDVHNIRSINSFEWLNY